MINISSPLLDEKEENAVIQVLRSGHLAQGEKVQLFEKEFAEYVGSKYAVAVSNGTTALHLALIAAGLGKDDEVITTGFSFIASSNAILYVGAKPVFVDIDPHTFNIDPKLIEEKIGKKTKAILPVHLYGLPADMESIMKIAKKHDLIVVEDAAQAHGAKINTRKVGSFGLVNCFSFYSTKNMTTGEGGMVTTNNIKIADKIRILRNHGMRKRYQHEVLGFNFRMTDIAAAIGVEQLKKLENFNEIRKKNALLLNRHLSSISEIVTPYIPPGYTHVFHQYTILVKNKRDELATYLDERGVKTMIYYPKPIHKQEFMENMFPDIRLPNTESIVKRVLSLPIHPALAKEDLKHIAYLINSFFKV